MVNGQPKSVITPDTRATHILHNQTYNIYIGMNATVLYVSRKLKYVLGTYIICLVHAHPSHFTSQCPIDFDANHITRANLSPLIYDVVYIQNFGISDRP